MNGKPIENRSYHLSLPRQGISPAVTHSRVKACPPHLTPEEMPDAVNRQAIRREE